MRRFGHILLCIVIFSVACSDEGGQTSGPPKPIRLHSIICDDDSYTIDCGGSVEVVFRVEEPKALFNYARSWEENFKLWDINTTINGDERLSFDDAVDRMIRIIEERIDIIDREL